MPVIGSDWWDHICDPLTGKFQGQVQILIALGSEPQIRNLEAKRGFNSSVVFARPTKVVKTRIRSKSQENSSRSLSDSEQPLSSNRTVTFSNLTNKSEGRRNLSSETKSQQPKSVNTATSRSSSLSRRESLKKSSSEKNLSNKTREMESGKEQLPEDSTQTKNLLEKFITELLNQKSKNVCVENSTNTDGELNSQKGRNGTEELPYELPKQMIEGGTEKNGNLGGSQVLNNPRPTVRNTSDLFESLEKALTVDVNLPDRSQVNSIERKETFRANIVVDSALHLPSRKKCRSKKSKNRNVKPEEILPSCYVTFETLPGQAVKVTEVVARSTSPKWDYRCDVTLPADLLTDVRISTYF